MIELIFNALSKFLNDTFPDYAVYDQYPARDFDMPSFVIVPTGGTQTRRLSDSTIQRGIDYQGFTIHVFDQNLYRLVDTVRELKIRLDRIDLANGDAFRVFRKTSNISSGDLHGTVSFTIYISETIKYKDVPKMEGLYLKENMNGSKE